MEAVCGVIDQLPEWTWRIPLLHRLGCPRGLALWAFALDPSIDTPADRPTTEEPPR
jgi:hypothetical protein